jgi:hypothetical protein
MTPGKRRPRRSNRLRVIEGGLSILRTPPIAEDDAHDPRQTSPGHPHGGQVAIRPRNT